VRWLKKFKHLWRVEVREPPSFEELETKASKNLEEDYEQKKSVEIDEAVSTLEDDETLLEEIEAHSAPDYDVGEVEMEDLLEESKLESHYGLNLVDAKIEDADEHLIDVEHIEPQ
tara:strand:- start:45 stop:389 length:345 start_codon:yes stop_codon:yes gene_type:complete